MEILHGVVVLVVVGGAFVAAILLFILSCFLVRVVWPLVIGAGGAYALWIYVEPFPAAIFALFCIVIQLWWLNHIKEDSYAEIYKAQNQQKKASQDAYMHGYLDM